MKTPRDNLIGRPRCGGLVLVVIMCCTAAAGCMGSWAIRGTRIHYNESYSHTASQEMLLNIVRMRYGEAPSFLDLPAVTTLTEASTAGVGAQPSDSPLQGTFGGTFTLRDEPTLSYQPRSGDNLAESLTQAFTAELLLDVAPGNDTRTFLLAFVDSINGVRNSPTATSPGSRIIEPNDEYRYVVDLIDGLQTRGALKTRVAKRDVEAHGAMPTKALPGGGKVPGAGMVAAAKKDYFYQVSGEEVTLLKHARLLALTIRPEDIDAADVHELTRILRLEPGRSVYAVKSQENDEIDYAAESDGASSIEELSDTLTFNVRSGYQMLAFLSKGVDVPESHLRRGTVCMFKTPDGQPFDARQLTRGLFTVCVQKHRPLRSDLAVHYRGHWFYIAEDDVQSRSTLSLIKLAIDLQSQSGNAGPVLTLPLN
jgi:hypothetical protein